MSSLLSQYTPVNNKMSQCTPVSILLRQYTPVSSSLCQNDLLKMKSVSTLLPDPFLVSRLLTSYPPSRFENAIVLMDVRVYKNTR